MGTVILLGMVLAVCLCTSFLLSGMEAGIVALSRFRVRGQMRAGVRRAQLLHEYLENPQEFLWTILVGNTLANFAAFSLVAAGLFNALDGQLAAFALAFTGAIFFFYMFCDLLPKMLFRQFPNRLCLAMAVPFRLMHAALSPLVAVLTWFSDALLRLTGRERFKGRIFNNRQEARLAIQESARTLTSEERSMVNRVLALQDLTVRSITIAMNRVVGMPAHAPVGELLELCRRQPVNRLPVWDGDGTGRRIIGIINISSLLYSQHLDPKQPVGGHAKAPLYFREDMPLDEALRQMQRTRQRMAVVLGFDQRQLGVVALRDILQSIFGEVTF